MEGLLFRIYIYMNARTPVKDWKKQTVKLKIITSCTPVLPQHIWPKHNNLVNMRIATDQNQTSVKYLKTFIFQERNSKL